MRSTRAAELAVAFDAEVIVTSVAQALVGAAAARGIGPIDPSTRRSFTARSSNMPPSSSASEGFGPSTPSHWADPATEILDLAESRNADLIVVGAREAGLLERLLDPSVSGAVQRKAQCDVLVVH